VKGCLTFHFLVDHFLKQAKQTLDRSGNNMIATAAIAVLVSYTWPGNVRQLRNVVERIVATSRRGVPITERDVHKALGVTGLSSASAEFPTFHENDSLDIILDRTLLRIYDQAVGKDWYHTQAAKMLHTDRVSLYQRIKRARQRLLLMSAL
jgi:two-component system response regulator HydG